MSFSKMGIQFLNKRRLRTILTVIAIVLGVGILAGVNVTADSIDNAINLQIDQQLGIDDIAVVANNSINSGWFNYQTAQSEIASVPGVVSEVPQINQGAHTYPLANSTGSWWVSVIGIDPTNANEPAFGKCNITAALDAKYVNTSQIEDLMNEYVNGPPHVILSQNYADSFNVKPGDPFYLLPENVSKFPAGMLYGNTSSWLNMTVIGIVDDTSKAIQDFMPPAYEWDFYPPSTAIYIDLNTAWNYIFNDHVGDVNIVLVHVNDPTNVATIQTAIEQLSNVNLFPGGIFTADVKSLFTSSILQVNQLMRGIFSIFSGISLLVCAIIIKNLLEMNKEEQTHEIGIMRAIGVTRSKILLMYIVQILFISSIGSAIGLLFGYYLSGLFIGSYISTASAVGTNFAVTTVTPVMSLETIEIGLAAGIGVSLIFGFFPARSAANIDPLEALHSISEKPQGSRVIRTIKKTGSLGIALGFTIVGIILIGSAFGGLFLLDVIDPTVVILLFLGVILTVVGIVFLGAWFFPVVIPAISTLFSPFLRKMRLITARNLSRYSRQNKNTFAMLTIGLCMMITVGTIMNSAYAGAYPGGKTITGGDLAIGNFYEGQIPQYNYSADINYTAGIQSLPSVAQAVPVRFSLGIDGLTAMDRVSTGKTFGGTQDSILGAVTEALQVGIIDPNQYAQLESQNAIVKLDGNDVSLSGLMQQLNTPYTVVIQDRLARVLGGVSPGEYVRMRFDGFEATFKVVGIFSILPGVLWSYYTTDDALDKQFACLISWNAYTQMMNDNVGNIDVIARNQFIPPANYSDQLPSAAWGYVSEPIDSQTLESVADQTGLVAKTSEMAVSPFYEIPNFEWQTNFTGATPTTNESTYSAALANTTSLNIQNVPWYQPGSLTTTWNTMLSRAYVSNFTTDAGFGNTTITATLPQIPASSSQTPEAIFAWAQKNNASQPVCIVNQWYVNYNITTGAYNYIKEFVPGDTIRCAYNQSLYVDYTVIATTNSHWPYSYIDSSGNHHDDTGVLNYKALSFNTYTYNTTDWSYFFQVLDAEPNSIFIPSYSANFPSQLAASLATSFANQYYNNGTGNSNTTSTGPLGLSSNSTVGLTLAWMNQALQNLYVENNTPYSGNISTDQWIGNYTFDNMQFEFNGAQFTYNGTTINMPIDVNLTSAPDVISQLQSGDINLTIQNFTSQVYFQLKPGMSYDDIQNFMNSLLAICHQIPTLKNVELFCPKLFLLQDSGLFNVFYWIGATSKDQINNALNQIENYYVNHYLPWNNAWVSLATTIQNQVSGILGLVINMFFGVLSFALIASLLGLSISTLISVKKRYAEFGTLRTLGFSNRQLLQMIVGEGVITAIFGIILGIIAGLLVAGLIINNLPFMIFLPMVLTPPYDLIGEGILIMIGASVLASFIPALSAVKMDIAEAIRTKGE